MPAFQIIGPLANVGAGVSGLVIPAGILLVLPTSPGGQFLLSNLGTEDVFFETGTSSVTCTLPAGADPGCPLLPRTQPIISIAPAQTHIYLICAANSARVVVTPGSGE